LKFGRAGGNHKRTVGPDFDFDGGELRRWLRSFFG